MLYLLVLAIVVSETIAISFLKKFSLSNNLYFFGIGLAFYALVSFFLIKSFKYEDMGIVNVMWSAFSVLMVVSIGILFFKEQISFFEVLAIALILIGVIILRFYN